MNTEKLIDATKCLCTEWKTVTKEIEKMDITNDVYSSTCKTDEAIALVIERIGVFVKAMAIAKAYDNLELANSHRQVLEQIGSKMRV